MTEHLLPDPNEIPQDVASLYSWANLHGGKYRDFSASRAQLRERARQRMEQAIEEERLRTHQETDVQQTVDIPHAQEDRRRIESSAPHVSQQSAQWAAHEAIQRAVEMAAQERASQAVEFAAQQTQFAAQEAAERAAQERARQATELATRQAQAARLAAEQAEAAQRAAREAQNARQAAPQASRQPPAEERSFVPPPLRPQGRLQEDAFSRQNASWLSADPREDAGRPAWLMPEQNESAGQPMLPPAPDETLQSSRERVASRWYALRSIFEDNVPAQAAPVPSVARAPVLALFSLAGGVGKTSLVATLGRVLSARGERVLLVDTAAYGLLPFFFGARDQRPGMLRTFSPPMASGDAPIQMITLDPDSLGPDVGAGETLAAEIQKHARGASRVIIDLATASGATTRRIMRLAPHILVPLAPDMSSVVSVSSIDAFFEHNGNGGVQKPALPFYVLNQFDPSLPLHLDIREVLREQLGDRLLPFVLRHTPVVSEALAEGMTVLDYAPNSAVTEDYSNLAAWLKSLSAPASTTFRGVRWSER